MFDPDFFPGSDWANAGQPAPFHVSRLVIYWFVLVVGFTRRCKAAVAAAVAAASAWAGPGGWASPGPWAATAQSGRPGGCHVTPSSAYGFDEELLGLLDRRFLVQLVLAVCASSWLRPCVVHLLPVGRRRGLDGADRWSSN